MMEEEQKILEQLISLMGFRDFSINYSEYIKRLSVFITDLPFSKKDDLLAQMINDINFIFKNILKQKKLDIIFVDINNYKKDREEIIIKFAKAAAKKSSTTKKPIELPAMNSFERRIIHNELSMHPNVTTYSEGEGKNRHVIVKPLDK